MHYLTKQSLQESLKKVGISEGDTVMVHSDISSFGIPENFSRKEVLNLFLEAFTNILGKDGTLCTPAYFYEYARHGIPFDIALSPVSKELGVFAKFINSLPESKRSCNPITSISAIGKNAEYICQIQNRHSYGEDSAFDKLYKLNAKIVLLGSALESITFGHYVEFRLGLPYIYNKIYNIPILFNNKVIFDCSYAAVRYLDYNIEYNYSSNIQWQKLFAQLYKDKKLLKTECLNSSIQVITTHDFFEYTKKEWYKNPYFMLKQKPSFIDGCVPNDGPTSKIK